MIIDIGDPADPRVDDFRDLNSVDRRPDLPSGKGLVIAEGVLVAQRMLASRFHPHALLGTERRRAELGTDLAGVAVPYYRTSAEVMAEVVGFHLNRGVLAAARRAPELTVDEVVGGARTVAVLEGVNDHENLGSIFRNAAGLGVDPRACAVVEDTVSGVAAGVAAGATVFGFAPGDAAHTAPEALRAAGAAHVFTDMAELPALLARASVASV